MDSITQFAGLRLLLLYSFNLELELRLQKQLSVPPNNTVWTQAATSYFVVETPLIANIKMSERVPFRGERTLFSGQPFFEAILGHHESARLDGRGVRILHLTAF